MRKAVLVIAVVTAWLAAVACGGGTPPPQRAPEPAPPPPPKVATSEPIAPEPAPPPPPSPADASVKRGPSVASGAVVIRGRLARDDVRRTVEGTFDDLTACYRDALGRDPLVGGGLTVRLNVGPRGTITRVDDIAKMGDEPFRTCVLDRLKQIAFSSEDPSGGHVDYGLLFATDDPPPPRPPPPPAKTAKTADGTPPSSGGWATIGIGTIGTIGGRDGGSAPFPVHRKKGSDPK